MQRFLRVAIGWIFAVVTTMIFAVICQTQNLIARLGGIGGDVGMGERLSMTVFDITHLGTLYIVFIGIALLVAFLAGAGVFRLARFGRPVVYIVAGAVAMAVMLVLMKNAFFGVQLIAGARDTVGFISQIIAGGFGGWVFARLTQLKTA